MRLDPLLVETVLGPVHSQRWLPLLREHYRHVKLCYWVFRTNRPAGAGPPPPRVMKAA